MNRKKLIIALVIINLLLVGAATTLSAYKSHASGETTLELAKIIFNNKETTSASISLKGMKPGDNKELSFSVSNNGTVAHQDANDMSKYIDAEVGDEIAIGDEHFYVISNNNGHIVALAKYNLYVGNERDSNTNEVTPLTSPTGIQSSDARGYVNGDDTWIGTVAFSDNNGWPYANNDDINIKDYDGPVKTALYDTNTGYEKYLQATIPTATVRLITLAELEGLGCSSEEYSCEGAPAWVYSTSYWSGSACAGYGDFVWPVFSDGSLGNTICGIDGRFGVRPVVEFDVAPKFRVINDANYNGTLDMGDEFAIGAEHFYVLSNNNGQVKALAKYNLNVEDGMSWSQLVPNTQVGIQNELADGEEFGAVMPFYYENMPESINGTLDFRNYPGTINTALYGSDGYESYLQRVVPNLSMRLINDSDLSGLDCFQNEYYYDCHNSFSWLYDSFYWTATARTTVELWYIGPSKSGDGLIYDCANGIRPVIEFNMQNIPDANKENVTELNVRSDVNIEYTLTISTYYNVPYQIEVINSNNQRVLLCNDTTGEYNSNGVLSCQTDYMTLGYTNNQTDNYRIVISIPSGIGYEFSSQSDFVTIDIDSRQKVTS